MNLDPKITNLIEEQKKNGGIELNKLAPGTRIECQTRNTLYKITVLENDKFMIDGGHYFTPSEKGGISGCTWGGSMLKMKWLGLGMHMECYHPDYGRITTSSIQSLKVIDKDGKWEYDL